MIRQQLRRSVGLRCVHKNETFLFNKRKQLCGNRRIDIVMFGFVQHKFVEEVDDVERVSTVRNNLLHFIHAFLTAKERTVIR